MCAVANAPIGHGAGGADRWVLVPGTLCTSQVFDPMLDRLDIPQANRHFIAASAPHTSDFETPLKAAVGGGEIVCGFSLGAIIVAHNLAAVRRAKAIVLLAANPFPDPPENRINREAARDRIITAGAGRWIVDNWPTMSTDTGTVIRDFVAQMAEDSKDAYHRPDRTGRVQGGGCTGPCANRPAIGFCHRGQRYPNPADPPACHRTASQIRVASGIRRPWPLRPARRPTPHSTSRGAGVGGGDIAQAYVRAGQHP